MTTRPTTNARRPERPTMRLATIALVSALLSLPALGQDLVHKAPPQSRPVLITGATIHPISGPVIGRGFIAFDNGRITALGPIEQQPASSQGHETIDATGKHVYPGLIAAYSQLGLTEISAARATLDYAEVGQATPEVRAVVAVNPDSTLIPVARTNGVMLAGVFPTTNLTGQTSYFDGPGGIVPGRAGVITLDGWTWEQMAIEPDAGLVVNWPNIRPVTARWMSRGRDEQREQTEHTLRIIDQLFTDARAYRDARDRAPSGSTPSTLASDLRFEAMRTVLAPAADTPAAAQAQRPVFVLANDYDQIVSAVAFADRHDLRLVIVGGMDAHLCTDLLKQHDVAVIVTGVYRFPKRADGDYDEPFSLPAKLHSAGVRFCLSSGEEAANERNLPYAAATAVAFGLPHDQAIRAITLSSAEILGVADRYGALQPDHSATLIVTDGDVLEVTTAVEHAFIDGRRINLNNKQIELEKKYREKYRQQSHHRPDQPPAGHERSRGE